jgi:hypothetical protein
MPTIQQLVRLRRTKIMNATKVKEKKDYYKKETNLKI